MILLNVFDASPVLLCDALKYMKPNGSPWF